jgi:hypothetical protein
VANTLLEQRRGQMFPKLTAAQLARLERQGTGSAISARTRYPRQLIPTAGPMSLLS